MNSLIGILLLLSLLHASHALLLRQIRSVSKIRPLSDDDPSQRFSYQRFGEDDRGGGNSNPTSEDTPCQYTPATPSTPQVYPACPAGTPAPPYPEPVWGSTPAPVVPAVDDYFSRGGQSSCPTCVLPEDFNSAVKVLGNTPWYIWVYEKATQLYKLYQAVMQAINIITTIIDIVAVILSSCIDGGMTLPSLYNGLMNVSSLQVGDIILGAKNANMEKSWCKVLAVYPVNSNGVTFGGFTYDHLIVDNPYKNGTDASVVIAGQRGQENKGPIYTLMTDCDATYNSDGNLFTPISSAFCPNMPWMDYLAVMSAIRKVMAKTGNFWFDLSVYYDNPSDPNYPSFLAALPEMCRETLQCSKYGNCEQFEKTSSQFMLLHLNPAELSIVQKVFPNMGNNGDSLTGTLTDAVLGDPAATGSWNGILIIAGAVAAVVLGLVAFYFWRRMKTPSANTEAEKCAENDAEKMIEVVSIGSENDCDKD